MANNFVLVFDNGMKCELTRTKLKNFGIDNNELTRKEKKISYRVDMSDEVIKSTAEMIIKDDGIDEHIDFLRKYETTDNIDKPDKLLKIMTK